MVAGCERIGVLILSMWWSERGVVVVSGGRSVACASVVVAMSALTGWEFLDVEGKN
jgi:hypothetical protein